MTDIDLTAVPLAALTVEIKRRMNELEAARAELGLDSTAVPSKTGKSSGKSTASKAAVKRWAGWDAYKVQHPNATRTEFFKAKKAGKA